MKPSLERRCRPRSTTSTSFLSVVALGMHCCERVFSWMSWSALTFSNNGEGQVLIIDIRRQLSVLLCELSARCEYKKLTIINN